MVKSHSFEASSRHIRTFSAKARPYDTCSTFAHSELHGHVWFLASYCHASYYVWPKQVLKYILLVSFGLPVQTPLNDPKGHRGPFGQPYSDHRSEFGRMSPKVPPSISTNVITLSQTKITIAFSAIYNSPIIYLASIGR